MPNIKENRAPISDYVKKLLLIVASIFLIWQSYDLLIHIHEVESHSWGLLIFVAFITNLYITGIFAFAGYAFPTHKLMPLSYYKITDSKKLKLICKKLNVELFRKFLLVTFWKSKKMQQNYFNGKISGINHLKQKSMNSEFGHLLSFIAINLICLYLITIGSFKLSGFTFIINTIGNFYPIILQRHHRMRITKLQRLIQSKINSVAEQK